MTRPVVLSLGGGLDSFAMLVEGIARGERIDVVAFIDVGHPDDPGEWPGTYQHVEQVVRPLCAAAGIEFVRIDHTNYPVRGDRSLFAWLRARNQIPVAGPNRICTRIAKVERFEAWLDARFPGQEVTVWIGFESGEESRADKDPNAGNPRGPSYGRAPAAKAPARELALAWRWTSALAWAMMWRADIDARIPAYVVVQNGMTEDEVAHAIDDHGYGGIFVGGDTGWKLETGAAWVRFAHARGMPCHVGRVGPPDRVLWAAGIGADSIDSSLPIMFQEHFDPFMAALASLR